MAMDCTTPSRGTTAVPAAPQPIAAKLQDMPGQTTAHLFRALMTILRSVGPVISTRRSWKSAGRGATFQSPSRTCGGAGVSGAGHAGVMRRRGLPGGGRQYPKRPPHLHTPLSRITAHRKPPHHPPCLASPPSWSRAGSGASRPRQTWPAAGAGAPAAGSPCRCTCAPAWPGTPGHPWGWGQGSTVVCECTGAHYQQWKAAADPSRPRAPRPPPSTAVPAPLHTHATITQPSLGQDLLVARLDLGQDVHALGDGTLLHSRGGRAHGVDSTAAAAAAAAPCGGPQGFCSGRPNPNGSGAALRPGRLLGRRGPAPKPIAAHVSHSAAPPTRLGARSAAHDR